MRFLERLSFQSKITLVTFIMIVLAVVVGWGGIHFSILPAMERKIQADAWHVATGLLNTIRSISETDRRVPSQLHLELFWRLMPSLAFVELVGPEGKPVKWFGDERYLDRKQVEVIERKGRGVLSLCEIGEEAVYQVSVPLDGKSIQGVKVVRVGVQTDYIRHLRWHLFHVLSVVTLFMLTLVFFCIRWFSAMITKPVNRLLRLTQLLSRGQLEEVTDEFASSPPCRSGEFSPRSGGDSSESCSCPVLEGGLSGDFLDGGVFPHDYCQECDVFLCAGNDELMRLITAFQFMALELRRYRDQLHQRYEFEERLLEACPDGIIANDRKGNIVLYNTGAEHLLGYSRAEAKEEVLVHQLYPGNEAREIKKALLSDEFGGPGILVDYNTQTMGKDGKRIPIRLSATILYEKDDEFSVVGYFHDLTELQEHMSALFEANEQLNKANRELGRMNRYYLDMLSFVTHELKSPIANGYMSANALRQEIFGSLAPEQAIMVEATCRNLDQCMEMIRHYLDLSRIEKDELPVKPQRVKIRSDVIDPVLTALSSTIQKTGTRIDTGDAEDIEWVLDPELFRSVFTNLISNALKYGESAGLIRIAVQELDGRCRMEVWNSGAGLTESDMTKLFRKFQRLPAARQSALRGTGLGLFITRTVVKRHGGEIWVESEQGAWVSFIIELPRDGIAESTGADQGRTVNE